jgi:hypothetical protein
MMLGPPRLGPKVNPMYPQRATAFQRSWAKGLTLSPIGQIVSPIVSL